MKREGKPFQPGDLIALMRLRIIAIHGDEALLHYERPAELAHALRGADIPEAMRLSPHFWVRLEDVAPLLGWPAAPGCRQ